MPVEDSALVSARALAEATWDATPPPLLRLDIDLLPKVDPEIRGLLLLVLTGELTESPGAWSRLDPYSLDEKAPRIVLSVRNAEHVADFSDVRKVDSNYFSHFETVANPQKAYLESLTDSARRDADFKEISYNSAVSSHNIWRNQYSLNNVNWAYSAYSAAVDRYNSLVIQYNATPSTISRPVYLPYSFEQGRVRFGWTLDTEIKIGAVATVDAVKESVVSDFVRLGNKATDQSEAYRAFDGFDIEVDANAGLGHLMKTVALVKEAMNTDMAALTVAPIADLTPQESSILGWLYHPWGRQAALASVLDLPEWVVASATSLALKRDPPAPPARRLEAAPDAVSGPLNPESGAAALAMFVCQTISTGVDGIATGTATLIGPEGLMLTCAHVLRGNELSMEYPTGPWKGTYEGELVFVNTERDVALVLANDQWASVRLDAPVAAGEAIVAIGNPAMDVGGVNLGGVSRGIVSSPSVERGKDRYLTADISIASGSSGGPLFSLKDGCLVGVVQAVATAPGFPRNENQVAATGFLCLAAGAQSLREWLGLESGTR
jgi:S1-C subfamily serine protease